MSNIAKKILLPKVFRQSLEQHADMQSPLEACAILFGTSNDKIWETTDIFLTENIDKSEVNFTISNEQLMEGYTIAEDKGLDIVGIFHSHPNSQPSPSNTDIKFMKGNPVPWIIYSGVTKEMKAYLLDSDLIQIPIE